MSCKLWLNVWTCRSFTCPFTLRNLDRNPTAALISGFIVPRAQRVCIEKGSGDSPVRFCCFFVYVFVRIIVFLSSGERSVTDCACVVSLGIYLVEVEGRVVFRGSASDGAVLGNRRLLLVNNRGVVGGSLGATVANPPGPLSSSRVRFLRRGSSVLYEPPPPQQRHKRLQQQQPANRVPASG